MKREPLKPGDRFHDLVTIERVNDLRTGMVKWRCRCDCGELTIVETKYLRSGVTKSCGCRRGRRAKLR